ncbi:MAG: hypothetical protein ACPGYP_10565, partial [Solirubrobacterales bacterium]
MSMSSVILDIQQLSMLLELEPPFGIEEVQQARKTMAKRWHPDIAPPGKRQAHEDHLKVLNEAADELESLLSTMPSVRVQLVTSFLTGLSYLQTDFFEPEDHPPKSYPFATKSPMLDAIPSTMRRIESGLGETLRTFP